MLRSLSVVPLGDSEEAAMLARVVPNMILNLTSRTESSKHTGIIEFGIEFCVRNGLLSSVIGTWRIDRITNSLGSLLDSL